MARTITYQQAIGEALAQEMERDKTVVMMGEDVAGGAGAPGMSDGMEVLSLAKDLPTLGPAAASWVAYPSSDMASKTTFTPGCAASNRSICAR